MTNRGRPLPWSIREDIKRLAERGVSSRAISRILNISKETAKKYSGRQV